MCIRDSPNNAQPSYLLLLQCLLHQPRMFKTCTAVSLLFCIMCNDLAWVGLKCDVGVCLLVTFPTPRQQQNSFSVTLLLPSPPPTTTTTHPQVCTGTHTHTLTHFSPPSLLCKTVQLQFLSTSVITSGSSQQPCWHVYIIVFCANSIPFCFKGFSWPNYSLKIVKHNRLGCGSQQSRK